MDIVSSLELVDSQQAIVMTYLSQEGQEHLYNQLEEVQISYTKVTEIYESHLTDIISKYLSEVIVYDILFHEIEEQLSMFDQFTGFNGQHGERAAELPVSPLLCFLFNMVMVADVVFVYRQSLLSMSCITSLF